MWDGNWYVVSKQTGNSPTPLFKARELDLFSPVVAEK
jgi:hypothetical protein